LNIDHNHRAVERIRVQILHVELQGCFK